MVEAVSPQGTIGYDYDAAGRRTAMAVAGQPVTEYQYDDGDRLRRILQGNEVVEFAYDDVDRLTNLTLPNDIEAGYAYNAASQLTGLAWQKPDHTPLHDLGYGYDSVGRRVTQTGSLAPQALPPASTGANAFDDNNRQTQYNGQSLTYDANGNLTGDGVRTYIWNARDQLVELQQGGSPIASFAYDVLGRRSSKTENGSTAQYLYDGMDTVQETQATSVIPLLTGLGIDERFARGEGANRHYFLTDALGSTRALTDNTGSVVQSYDYDPYGATHPTNTSVANPYRYTGREQDTSGLYYYRARYYHPATARFISEDPIGLAGGDLNTYAYVSGDPINFTDPLGLWSVTSTIYIPTPFVFGPGGSITIGRNPNSSGFVTVRLGIGAGGGVKVDPEGQRPGYRDLDGCAWGGGVGNYVALDFNAGPFYAGLGGARGVNSTPTGPAFYNTDRKTYGARLRRYGINASGGIGSEWTFFGGGERNECGCNN